MDCANGAHPEALSPSPCEKMMDAVCREVASTTIWLIILRFGVGTGTGRVCELRKGERWY